MKKVNFDKCDYPYGQSANLDQFLYFSPAESFYPSHKAIQACEDETQNTERGSECISKNSQFLESELNFRRYRLYSFQVQRTCDCDIPSLRRSKSIANINDEKIHFERFKKSNVSVLDSLNVEGRFSVSRSTQTRLPWEHTILGRRILIRKCLENAGQRTVDKSSNKFILMEYLKTLTRFLLSTIGLLLIEIGYIVIGAYSFQYLETEKDRSLFVLCNSMEALSSWKVAVEIGIFAANITKFSVNISQHIINFANDTLLSEIHLLHKDLNSQIGYDSLKYCQTIVENWSLLNSIVFVFTTITTIGYGNNVPKTNLGKIICILYALIGIPLTLIALASIGHFMATFFQFGYTKAIRPCIHHLKICVAYSILKQIKSAIHCSSNTKEISSSENSSQNNCITLTDASSTKSQTQTSTEQIKMIQTRPVNIPISLILIVIACYITSAAALFRFLEEWDWLESSYFCFITLTTIGFGDYVPNKSINNYGGLVSISSALMLFLGLVVISMCFSLLQKSVRELFHQFCISIGLKTEDKMFPVILAQQRFMQINNDLSNLNSEQDLLEFLHQACDLGWTLTSQEKLNQLIELSKVDIVSSGDQPFIATNNQVIP